MTTALPWFRRVGVAGIVLLLGCGGDPTGPAVPQGAGLAVVLPDSLGDSVAVRVELWRENVVPPPTCSNREAPAVGPASPAIEDSCTVGSLWIRDLLGNVVRVREGVRWNGRIPGWDGRSDSGAEVPAGVYPVHWECGDSRNPFVFDGHYYVPSPDDPGSCDWILWSTTVNTAAGRRFTFRPFPVKFGVLSLVTASGIPAAAFFENPYRVRIRIPERGVFEREVTLIEKQYTEVRVEGSPPAGGSPARP
jgi:hypothetical protein